MLGHTAAGSGEGGMPTKHDLFGGPKGTAMRDPEFERLHPRGKGGKFVDVAVRLKEMGATWSAPNMPGAPKIGADGRKGSVEVDLARGVWMVPADRQEALEALLSEAGYKAVVVPEGMRPATPEDRKRLNIPPAYTDAMVSMDVNAKVTYQARTPPSPQFPDGQLKNGYNLWWDEQQAAIKYERIRQFDTKLDDIDTRLSAEAPTDDTAAALMVMRKTGIRTGGGKQRGKKKSYAASTLERRHVTVTGDRVRLKFDSKSGKHTDMVFEDAELARVLSSRLKGKKGSERIFNTSGDKMSRWIDRTAPGHKPYDFRTHLGTSTALKVITGMRPPKTEAELRAARNEVGDRVSSVLGNTRTVALASYIDPAVFRGWEVGVAHTAKQKAPTAPMPMGSRSAEEVAHIDTSIESMVHPKDAEKVDQAFESVDQLFEVAATENAPFEAQLQKATGQQLAYDDAAGQAVTKTTLVMGPLKEKDGRAVEKVASKYGGDFNKLQDVVRGTVVVPTLADLPSAYAEIKKNLAPGWKIKKFENRFGDPPPPWEKGATVLGYRDAALALVSPSGVATELQLTTSAMWKAKTGHGHELYTKWRKIDAAIKLRGGHPTIAEWHAMLDLEDAQKALYNPAAEASYG